MGDKPKITGTGRAVSPVSTVDAKAILRIRGWGVAASPVSSGGR